MCVDADISIFIISFFYFLLYELCPFYKRSSRSQNEKIKVYFCEISSEISQKAIK